MVIQVILTLGLLLSLVYAFIQQAATRLLRLSMAVVVLFGTYLVWFPRETVDIARLLGVGRGADLITYCWMVISLLLILILHLRTVRLKLEMTELARYIAVLEGEKANPHLSSG